MKQVLDKYFDAVRAWDKKHRIVGRVPIETLIAQSEEALGTFISQKQYSPCLVDVGAGAGIVGLAWLLFDPNHQAVFIEPDKKKIAFLRDLFANKVPELSTRVLILPHRLEDVSRETLVKFAKEGFFLAARAFSGEKTLEESFSASGFSKDNLYIFEGALFPSKKFVLRQVVI